jgi:hypothetical protein
MSLTEAPPCALGFIELRVEEARFQGGIDVLSAFLATHQHVPLDTIVVEDIQKQLRDHRISQAVYTSELKRREDDEDFDQGQGSGKGKDAVDVGKGEGSGKHKKISVGKGKDKDKWPEVCEVRVFAQSSSSGTMSEYHGFVQRANASV